MAARHAVSEPPDRSVGVAGPTFAVGELVLRAMRDAGVREIFGIPGDFVLPFFKLIEETAILPLYTLCHEPAVGFAADGASRVCCRPSAAVVTYGAGALNMVNPIAAAYAEKSPVVVISGGPGVGEQHSELLLHHQAKRMDSQFQVYKEVTCAQTRLRDPSKAAAEISRVLSMCLVQSRPVYIEMPRDQVLQPSGRPLPLDLVRAVDPAALEACVSELLATLKQASRPVLMVGVEVRRLGIEDKVAKLADRLKIPVVTSFMGRGLLAGRWPAVCGTYLGRAGQPRITDMVEHSDALLLLGVILSDTNLGTSRQKIDLKKCILALDGSVTLGYHTYPDIPLDRLVEALLVRLSEHPEPFAEVAPSLEPEIYPDHLESDEQPIVPDDIAAGVNDLIGRHGRMQVVTDVGDCLFVAMDIADTELAAPGYYASMGFAVPAGLGIQASSGQRPLILLGDGAFQMTGWELGNCRRYGWDPIVIVLNNTAWEMLRAFEPECRFNKLDRWNFAELANSLGGQGFRVRTRREFQQALHAAYEVRGRFQLIEVVVDRGSVSRTMRQFVHGIRAGGGVAPKETKRP